jgi:hypothetical protein
MAIVDFDTECWNDPWVQKLQPLAKLLFVYLWTNVHRNISGIYVITPETISFETGLTRDQVDALWPCLEPKVRYDPECSLCWVVKHARRQFLRSGKLSPKLRAGIRKHVWKFRWHPFSEAFAQIYPEIFTPQEVEVFAKADTKSDSMDTLSILLDTSGGKGKGGGSFLFKQ